MKIFEMGIRRPRIFHKIACLLTLLIIVLQPFVYSAHGDQPEFEDVARELSVPDDLKIDRLGTSICLIDDIVVLGAPNDGTVGGRALIYRFEDPHWNRVSELRPTTSVGSFGFSCAGNNESLIVVAPDQSKLYEFGSKPPFSLTNEFELENGLGTTVRIAPPYIVLGDGKGFEHWYTRTGSKLKFEKRTPATPRDDKQPCFDLPPSKFGLTGEFTGVCIQNDQWRIVTLRQLLNGAPIQRVYAIKIKKSEEFISEEEAEKTIADACGASPELSCVEATLHSLWEQKKIFYTVYDSTFKRAWAKNHAQVNTDSQAAAKTDAIHKLFRAAVEQTWLEQLLVKDFHDIVALDMQYISVQISGANSAESTGKEILVKKEEGIQRVRRLQKILRNLMSARPELPRSPYLEPPYTNDPLDSGKLVSSGVPSLPQRNSFKAIGGSL